MLNTRPSSELNKPGLPRSNLRRGEAVRGTHRGLRQHGQTTRIVPEIDRRWHFVDLTCNAASQTSGDGANSPIPLQAGGTAMITGEFFCWIRAERGLSNTQDLVVKLYYRKHEGTHLRFLQSRSTGAAQCVVVVWSVQDVFYHVFYNIYFDPYQVVSPAKLTPNSKRVQCNHALIARPIDSALFPDNHAEIERRTRQHAGKPPPKPVAHQKGCY